MRIPAIIVILLSLLVFACAAPAKSTVIQPVPLPVPAGPVINYFYASPAAVTCPATATLSWKVTDADNITIDQGIGPVAAAGNMTVSISAPTTFTLTAKNGNLKTVDSTTVLNCTAPPTGSLPVITFFDTTPNVIPPGEIITLVWQVTGATSVSLDNGLGTVNASGRYSIMPQSTTVYTLTATNASGFATAQVTAQVQEPGLTSYYLSSYTTPHVGVQGIVGDQFTILEDASPSQGYKWLVDYYDPTMVNTVSENYTVYNPPTRGSEGQQQFIFTALAAGDTRILISSVNNTVPTDTRSIYYDVHIQPK